MTRSVVSSDSIESPAVFTPRPGLRVLGDDGRDLEPGSAQEGLIAVTGHIPLGYMNDPEATAKTFPVIDGVRYVVPGDRARVLADGRIELLGRGSSCINTGGEKVYPEEVEEVLHSHPDVVDTAVLGVSDDRWGEMVVALVVTSSPADISEDLRSLCRAHLARYKCPKHFFNVDAVDRTVAGKLDVPRLRERLGALI
jgi:acyl-CoA synthetase (AMP-forming)/AMP-acid ligase II